MRYRKLGKTDIEISKIGFGTWALSGGAQWGEQDDADAVNAVAKALDVGMTFLDTAEGYGKGKSEKIIGRALKDGKREKAVIASKVSPGNLKADDLKQSCEKSLERMDTDYIDLYQVHWPNTDVPIEETMQALQELKDAGKIRAIGISNFGPRDMNEIFKTGVEVASNQLAYNLVFRAIEYDILPICREHGLSVLAYSPLMQGVLTGKFAKPEDVSDERARTRIYDSERHLYANHGETGAEDEIFDFLDVLKEVAEDLDETMAHVALAWVSEQDGVGSAIVGGRNPSQVDRNVKAGDLELPADAIRRLSDESEGVKAKMGPNADMWQVPSRIH